MKKEWSCRLSQSLSYPDGLVKDSPVPVKPLKLCPVSRARRHQSLQSCDVGLTVLQVLLDHLRDTKQLYECFIHAYMFFLHESPSAPWTQAQSQLIFPQLFASYLVASLSTILEEKVPPLKPSSPKPLRRRWGVRMRGFEEKRIEWDTTFLSPLS